MGSPKRKNLCCSTDMEIWPPAIFLLTVSMAAAPDPDAVALIAEYLEAHGLLGARWALENEAGGAPAPLPGTLCCFDIHPVALQRRSVVPNSRCTAEDYAFFRRLVLNGRFERVQTAFLAPMQAALPADVSHRALFLLYKQQFLELLAFSPDSVTGMRACVGGAH